MTAWEDALDRWSEALDIPGDRLRLPSGRSMWPSLESLGEVLDTLDVARVMLVVDRVAVAAAGMDDVLDRALGRRTVVVFDRFTPNPRAEDAVRAARLAAEHRTEAVVAVGGGSCLDTGKVAALAARTPEWAERLSQGDSTIEADPLPVVAVPTTSGTGSEATRFAAMYVDGRKVSVANVGMRPRAAVLDPRLHQAMPPQLAAATGLDALGQCMESLWAVEATEESALDAAAGGRLVAAWLEESVTRPSSRARVAVMLGAHLGGRAIDVSKTTAAHALSYQLTMRHGIPHGHAVGLTLGHVGAANAEVTEDDCTDPRGPEHTRRSVRAAAALLGVEPAALPESVASLIDRLGLPSSLSAAGVPADDVPALAQAIDPVRSGNNPRRLDARTTLALMQRAWSHS